MKWTYIIRQKMKAAIALGIVFILVFATNLINNNHFSELQNSFSSVYKDRLVVAGYIYKLSNQFHQKKALFDLAASDDVVINKENKVLNDSIQTLIQLYGETFLTPTEADYFDRLKEELAELNITEKEFTRRGAGEKGSLYQTIIKQHNKLLQNLDNLSEIQMAEGKRIIEESKQIIATSNMTLKLEIGILIVIGLIVQALIFSSKSMTSTMNQRSSLN